MTGAELKPTFNHCERGDRTKPGWSNSRRVVLNTLNSRMQSIATVSSGCEFLDYGCGNQPYRSLFSKNFAEYIAADLPGNPDANLTLNPDGTLPTPEESIDTVLSSQVLEHVGDPCKYLQESNRVLRHGGRLIISTHGVWPYHPDPADYWRWTPEGLRKLIEENGFSVETIEDVCGRLSTTLQLLQDATLQKLPYLMRGPAIGFWQSLIWLVESQRKADAFSPDSAVFVVVARKTSNLKHRK